MIITALLVQTEVKVAYRHIVFAMIDKLTTEAESTHSPFSETT